MEVLISQGDKHHKANHARHARSQEEEDGLSLVMINEVIIVC